MNPFYWLIAKGIETDAYRKFARSWMANFTFRVWGWPQFPCSEYFNIYQAVEAYKGRHGMLVYMATDSKSLSFVLNNKLTGCAWAHTGFITLNNGMAMAKSMTSNGLKTMSLLDYLSKVDNFCVGFLPMSEAGEAEAKRRLAVVDEAARKGEISYDFTVRMEQQIADFIIRGVPLPAGKQKIKLYCSEYVYLTCCGLVSKEFKTSWFYDRDVFEPDDIYHASTIIYEKRYAKV